MSSAGIAAGSMVATPVRDRVVEHGRSDLVHTGLAALYVFLLPLETAPKEIAFAILLVFSFVRFASIWRSYVRPLQDWLTYALPLWAGWTALTVLWSIDPEHGREELHVFRFLLTGFVLWPVMHRRTVLIAAFLLAVVVQNGFQLAQSQELFGIDQRPESRLGGLASPIVAGTLCAMAMCWHLSAIVTRRGALRWWCVAGFTLAAMGLVFSGSRGPWIAATIGLSAQLLVTAIRRPEARRPILVLTVSMALGALAVSPVAWSMVRDRIDNAQVDLALAEEGTYGTNVGFRLLSWQHGWDMIKAHPIKGAGAGSFFVEVERVDQRVNRRPRRRPKILKAGHGHSMYIQVFACTGLVGIVLLGTSLIAHVRRALVDCSDDPWTSGTAFALIVFLAAGAFDSFHVAGQAFAIMVFLLALTQCAHRRGHAPMRPLEPAETT